MMDVVSAIEILYRIAYAVVKKCQEVEQCKSEAERIGLRVQNLMATLDGAKETFCSTDVQAKLLELHHFLDELLPLLQQAARKQRSVRALATASTLVKTLRGKEEVLKQLQDALGLAMLPAMASKIDRVPGAVVEGVSGRLEAAFDMRVVAGEASIRQIFESVLRRKRAPRFEGDGGYAAASADRGSVGRLCRDRLEIGEKIGEGSFGEVHAATYFSSPVAVKTLKSPTSFIPQEAADQFRREVETQFALRHPNIVQIFCYSMENPLTMVMELMEMSVRDIIRTGHDLDFDDRLQIALGTCEGLSFLHSLGLMHMDLKSLNILLDENNVPKLSDFGLVRVTTTVSTLSGGGYGFAGGSELWMAPEFFSFEHPKPAQSADIFSLHVVIYEILELSTPGRSIGRAKVDNGKARLVLKTVPELLGKYLGERGLQISGELQRLVDACGALEPGERCSSSTVLDRLSALAKNVGDGKCPRDATPAGPAALTVAYDAADDPSQSNNAGWGPVAPVVAYEAADDPLPSNKTVWRPTAYPGDAPLMDVYHATGGPSWDDSTGWGTAAPVGDWYGVSSRGGRVMELVLERNFLTGSIPPAVGTLTGLLKLELGGNRLIGSIPPDIGNLPALCHLGLGDNELSGLIPHQLASLSCLVTLILSNNFLEGPVPPELGNLTMLAELDLSMNDLTGSIPSSLAEATSLEQVRLQCNGFRGNVPRTLKNLKCLKELVLDWSILCDTHPFRKYRKASPPPTEAELQRAQSASRSKALQRARVGGAGAIAGAVAVAGAVGVGGQGARTPLSLSREDSGHSELWSKASNSRGSQGAPTTPYLGEDGIESNAYASASASASSCPRTPSWRNSSFRKLKDDDCHLHQGNTNEPAGKPAAPAGAVGQGGGRTPLWVSRAYSGHSELWSIGSNGHSAQEAPTAPYMGEDGMESKARASASTSASTSASAPPPTPKRSNRWMATFKDVVGSDFGFS